MAGILGDAEPTPEERDANDGHSLAAVAAVVVALLALAWCFTDLAPRAGLPAPRDVAGWLGLGHLPVFAPAGCLVGALDVDLAPREGADGRVVFFVGLLLTFLATYFTPARWKRHALGLLGVALALALFGERAGTLLVAGLLAAFLAFHPRAPGARAAAFAAGALGAGSLAGGHGAVVASILGLGAGAGAMLAFVAFGPTLARPRASKIARTLAGHLALVATLGALVHEARTGSFLAIPFGLALLLWQFQRLHFHHMDVEDGTVPEDLSPLVFLATFVSPPALLLATRGLNVGQGTSYQSTVFLGTSKNRLVRRGLALWGLAFLYLAFGDALMAALGDALASLLGVPVYTLFPSLLKDQLGHRGVPATTVLVSTFLSQLRWYLSKAGPIHFMVGAYRVLGYDVAAHYDSPLLATNLVSLWARFTFHYREYLGRAFYYPVFLKLAGWPKTLRIAIATFAAAAVGNLVWGHAVFASVASGLHGSAFLDMLRIWPYFLLLGGGITLTEVWLLKRGRKRRVPWTRDRRIWLDVLAAYATFQFFALIEIFFFAGKFPERTLWEHAALFLRAFGIGG